jgi:hypothetical protein
VVTPPAPLTSPFESSDTNASVVDHVFVMFVLRWLRWLRSRIPPGAIPERYAALAVEAGRR